MSDLDIESDEFLVLLTDALRSGPGSPQWHQAVSTLRTGSPTNLDEYTLLCRAREHLESGKDYRSVRAGPAFTSKVLQNLSRHSVAGPTRAISANLIAFLSIVVIASVIIVVAFVLMHGSDARREAVDDLAGVYFGNTLLPASRFDNALPPGWRQFGELPVLTRYGLRPSTLPAAAPDVYKTGGIVTLNSIDPAQPLALTVQLHLNKPQDPLVTQVFLTDHPVDGDQPTGHDLVWQFKAGEASVFLSGHAEPASQRPQHSEITLRILLNRDTAIVDSDGVRLYAGPAQLDTQSPRWLGIRFLRPGSEKPDDAVVGSITVQKP